MRGYPSLDKELALEASGIGPHGLKSRPLIEVLYDERSILEF